MTTTQIKIGDTVEFTDAYGEWVKGIVISYDDEFTFYNVKHHDSDKVCSAEAGCFSIINGERQ